MRATALWLRLHRWIGGLEQYENGQGLHSERQLAPPNSDAMGSRSGSDDSSKMNSFKSSLTPSSGGVSVIDQSG